MRARHTPGPWVVLPPSLGIDHNWHVTDNGDTFVAHVFGFAHAVDRQSEINAHLIASAPDMLFALELLVAGIEGSVSETYLPLIKARAAIDKATCNQGMRPGDEIYANTTQE